MSELLLAPPDAPSDPTAPWAYALCPQPGQLGAQGAAPLSALPSAERVVVLVVPAQRLAWHKIILPAGSLGRGGRPTARLRAVIDGMLEDAWLDDAADLHVALQPQASASAPLWLVCCERAWLQAGVTALQQAGLEVGRILPELPEPAAWDALWVGGEPEQPWLAAPWPGGDAGLVAPFTPELAQWLRQDTSPPEHVLAEPAVAGMAQQWLDVPVQVQSRGQRWLWMAQSAWDMAQFDFTPANQGRGLARGWRVAQSLWHSPVLRPMRWALAFGVLAQVVGLNVWAWRETAAQRAQQQLVREVLTQTFPKVPVVVDAPVQMAREVATLQRSRGGDASRGLLGFLASFSALAPEKYALSAIQFEGEEAHLTGPALDALAQQRLQDGLRAQGIEARWQSGQWLLKPGVLP
jgi:general secretion pathway protein L